MIFFCIRRDKNPSEIINVANKIISKYNKQTDIEESGRLKEDKLKLIRNESHLYLWLNIKKEVYHKIHNTEFETVMKSKFIHKHNYLYASTKLNMSTSRYYDLLNKIYELAVNLIYRYNLISYNEKGTNEMNEYVIKSNEQKDLKDIQEIIDNSVEYSEIKFSGIFNISIQDCQKIFFQNKMLYTLFIINKPNLTLNFSGAVIEVELNEIDADFCLFLLTSSAKDTILTNISTEIKSESADNSFNLYSIFNNAKSLKIQNSRIRMNLQSKANITAIYNNGDSNNQLETKSDCLSLDNNYIEIINRGEGYEYHNSAIGIYNNKANSISLTNNTVFIQNSGNSQSHAIGIYNSGRYARVNNNNIKANGNHSEGKLLNKPFACGYRDEGVFSVICNNNIIGEWGGECVGLELNGSFTKVSGNKILATHTIKGCGVKVNADKNSVSDNIIVSTSRNPRLINVSGDNILVANNYLEALLADECVSGCGAYFSDSNDCSFTGNHIRNIRNCGIFLKNSKVLISDNVIVKNNFDNTFKDIAADDEITEMKISENKIKSLSD